MAIIEEFACDDVQLDEAEAIARSGLQSAGSGGLGALIRSRPGTASAWSGAQSAPSLGCWPTCWSSGSRDPPSSPPSRPGSRPGTGRFSPDELACFRRVHTPSSSISTKAGLYWQDEGALRRSLSETGWHSLPVSKGRFYTPSRLNDQTILASSSAPWRRRNAGAAIAEMVPGYPLPDEALTAKVLNEIYPKTKVEKLQIKTDLSPDRSQRDTPAQGSFLHKESDMLKLFQQGVRKIATLTKAAQKLGSSRGMKVTVRTDQTPPRKTLKDESPNTTRKTLKDESPNATRKRDDSPNASPFKSRAGTPSYPPSPMNCTSPSSTSPGGASHADPFHRPLPLHKAHTALEMMLMLRNRFLEHCKDLQEVLDIISGEIPPGSGVMTRREWRRSLTKIGMELTKEEREATFKLLDVNNDGAISLTEVQIVIEAASPVRTLTDLRRRWLASGFHSMCAALHEIEGGPHGVAAEQRLFLKQFGEALIRVNVFDHSEHMALFNIILDPSDPSGRVSIGELMCAVATVSPSLLLEDVRDRLLRNFNGSIENAYWTIDADHSGELEHIEFVNQCHRRLDLTHVEAEKVFRMIDLDNSGVVSRLEFLSALAMSEPSLFLEDLRQKVRQRFRSIFECFAATIADAHLTPGEAQPRFTLPRFQMLLSKLDLTEIDTRVLFELIDTDLNGSLTLSDFLKATRQLAPSCVFENLRLKCIHRSMQISEVFGEATKQRSTPMDFDAFSELITELNLAENVNLKVIFDVLDVKNEGMITLGRLIAALQAGGPGKNVRLNVEEQKVKAEKEIRGCTASVRRLAGDLKTQMRLGSRGAQQEGSLDIPSSIDELGDDSDQERIKEEIFGTGEPTSPYRKLSFTPTKCALGGSHLSSPNKGRRLTTIGQSASTIGQFQAERKRAIEHEFFEAAAAFTKSPSRSAPPSRAPSRGGQMLQEGEEPMAHVHHAHGPPRLRNFPQHELQAYRVPLVAGAEPMKIDVDQPRVKKCMEDNRQSWGRVWGRLQETSGTDDREDLQKKVHNYYQTATWSLSHDGPLLEQSPSRHLMHRNMQAHHSVLEPDKIKALQRAGDDGHHQR